MMKHMKILQKGSLFLLLIIFSFFACSAYAAIPPPNPQAGGAVQGTFDSPTTTSTFSGLICNLTQFISDTLLPPIAVLMALAVGFMFLVSQGDPGKTATAKKGLLFIAVGVFLLLLAPSIVSLIASIFDTSLSASPSCSASQVSGSIVNTLVGLVNWFSWFVAITSVVMGLYGGFLFITAKDDPAQSKKARGVIAYTIIGVAVAIISFGIIAIVKNFLG